MKFKNVLITGATGYIGSHLAAALIQEGVDVGIIVRPSSDLTPISRLRGQLKIYYYDGNGGAIRNALSKQNPDIIFHVASLFLATHTEDDILPLINSNILFSTQLLEAMSQTGFSSLINTGTSWQHYNNAKYDPVCLYAATKQAFEVMMKYYVSTNKIQAITLKLFDTYGGNDPRKKLIPLLVSLTKSQQNLSMSPGEQLIDIVHINDVVRAYIVAADRLIEFKNGQGLNESYGISSGRPITLRTLVKTLESASGKNINIGWGQREYRDREVMQPWASYSKLPNWQPKVPLEKGLTDLISSLNQAPESIGIKNES